MRGVYLNRDLDERERSTSAVREHYSTINNLTLLSKRGGLDHIGSLRVNGF